MRQSRGGSVPRDEWGQRPQVLGAGSALHRPWDQALLVQGRAPASLGAFPPHACGSGGTGAAATILGTARNGVDEKCLGGHCQLFPLHYHTHMGWASQGDGAPQTPPAPSAPALLPGQQHAQASASRGCASETPFLISFLPPHPDVL